MSHNELLTSDPCPQGHTDKDDDCSAACFRTSKQVLDKKQVAASNAPFKAQNLGRDPEAQGPSPLDLLQAEIERLRAAISEHNTACQARCGVGDREAMECGYRPYFENTGRRCPNCPTYEMIDMPADETPAVNAPPWVWGQPCISCNRACPDGWKYCPSCGAQGRDSKQVKCYTCECHPVCNTYQSRKDGSDCRECGHIEYCHRAASKTAGGSGGK